MLLVGIMSASSGNLLTTASIPFTTILTNIPITCFWICLNILVISISNQRLPAGILEDKINKPWRPIASGRIGVEQASQLLFVSVIALLGIGYYCDILNETMGCLVANWIYNDLEGGDANFVIRQVINGLAYLPCGVGATKLIVGNGGLTVPNDRFYEWILVISMVVGTTTQVQDLKDLEGDRARNRHTFPVVLGDFVTRFSCCVGIAFWSVWCFVYWDLKWQLCSPTMILGAIVIFSISVLRGQKADKRSFLLWSFWVMSLLALPTMKAWQ
jgi:4-hydroxybenzoate polyprenyltransferase